MKKIYAFSIDDEESLSDKFKSDIRLLAYLLYDSIYGYDERKLLNINKNIVFNRIHESFINNYYYYLDSDCYDAGFINYEPFLLGDRIFALTVDDEFISENDIMYLLNSALSLLKLNFRVNIFSENYFSKDIDDEKNRHKAINSLCSKMGLKICRKTDFVKRLIYSSKRKKNINCYGRY